MDQVEEVKSKVDIVEIVSQYVTLKKAGRNFKGLCPFHGEKTPSFMVNPELQIFKCFGCQKGGDVFTFLQEVEGQTFGETLSVLAEKVGIKLTNYKSTQDEDIREKLININIHAADYYHYLLTKHDLGKAALEYVKNRGINDQMIEMFKLGFAPHGWDYLTKYLTHKKGFLLEDLNRVGLITKTYDRFRNRIIFPLNNARGQVLGFAGRLLPNSEDKAGKYINTSETDIYHKSEMLYGLDIARSEIKSAGFAVVVEGEIDCIASIQSGVKNTVAIKGSALTDKQVQTLRRLCDTIILALDADFAGDAAARRGIEIAQKAGLFVQMAILQNAKDPGDLAISHPDDWKEIISKAIPIYDFYLKSAVERFGLEIAGKKKISQELLPIWQLIDDEIVKAHYIKLLAKTLNVDETDIRNQMAKAPKQSMTTNDHRMTTNDKKSQREIIEEYVVELALKGNKVLPELQTPFWGRVAEELKTTSIKELPVELREKTENLLLKDGEFEEIEWHKTINRLEELDVREQLKQPIADVEMKKLSQRLGELTKSK